MKKRFRINLQTASTKKYAKFFQELGQLCKYQTQNDVEYRYLDVFVSDSFDDEHEIFRKYEDWCI